MSQAQAHKACFLAKCFPILKIAPVFCSARVQTHLYCSTHRYLGTHICELQAKLASRGLQHKMCSCSVYLYSCWCCSSMCLVLSVTDSYPWVLMQRILAGWGLNVRSRKGRKLIFFCVAGVEKTANPHLASSNPTSRLQLEIPMPFKWFFCPSPRTDMLVSIWVCY